MARHGEGRVDEDRAAPVLLDRDRSQQRIRSRSRGPHQRLGRNLSIGEDDHARSRVGERVHSAGSRTPRACIRSSA